MNPVTAQASMIEQQPPPPVPTMYMVQALGFQGDGTRKWSFPLFEWSENKEDVVKMASKHSHARVVTIPGEES